ncbi:general secretion pathway protein GspL [Parahaliea aestuarii]|uniref:General secretion pathway protein GspL n=1 Tax=Parahaliea aestuarii TaxID=1852021 RepID=A0A5C8ZQY3_9GAMM|nr:general secretion pathway protein GspL [Parahaliea aestuarii]TXS90070.1 general secretion pathway protein GspL [Parahaliea aestuarii]
MNVETTGQQWQLFGYDVRHLGQYWQRAWAEFLWGDHSPVRARLDEVVELQGESGAQCFHSGVPVAAQQAECRAILLPESLVLFRTLRLPRAAEAELDAVMALEVSSNSPFPAQDTASGWSLLARNDTSLQVQLAITSLSAAMTYLGSRYDIHDVNEREVWAQSGERPIVLRGFGEGHRLARYKRRLLRMGGFVVMAVLLLLAILLVSVGGKFMEMQQYRELSERVTAETREAAEYRELLAAANQTITSVDKVSRQYPNPHVELARLTGLLGDDAHIVELSVRGTEMRLRGRSTDAASVIEKLTSVPAFSEVSAEQGGITKLGNTGLEQFYVTIRLREEQGA